MSIISLSSDFGLNDPYLGIMKGVILGINPQAQLVDLTHALANHHLMQAAFILQTAYAYFPKGTVHLAVVDPGVGSGRRLLAVQGAGQIWVGPDNGLFTLILKKEPQAKTIQLTRSAFFLKQVSSTFHGRDILAPVAAHLSLGTSPEEMGPVIHDPVLLSFPEPEIKDRGLEGEVLWADHFGNLITNISEKKLRPFFGGQSLTVLVGSETIPEILQTYSQSPPGRLMALIGSSGYLEIACNMGRAEGKIGFQAAKRLIVRVTCS